MHGFSVESREMKQPLLLMSLLVIALAIGCKKHEPAANATPPPAQPGQPAATSADNAPAAPSAAPAAAGAVAAPAATDINATLTDLTRRARSYVASTRQVPGSFEEFVAANPGLQIPVPPAGKKYAFGAKMRVILVNR